MTDITDLKPTEAGTYDIGDPAKKPEGARRAQKQNDAYLVERLESIIELINAGETHMAVAKLLADISALKA